MTGCFFEAADQPWVELPITENVFSLLLAYNINTEAINSPLCYSKTFYYINIKQQILMLLLKFASLIIYDVFLQSQ